MALLFMHKTILLLIHVTTKSSAKHVDRKCFCVLISIVGKGWVKCVKILNYFKSSH